jgi:metal-responsive CopG/Arc/MetJ family transcriptional regulator
VTDLKHATYDVKNRKTVPVQASLYPADYELMEMIQDQLGCSRSEVIRSAIRIMATQLPLKSKP